MDIRAKLSLGSYPFDMMPQAFIDLVFNPDAHTNVQYVDLVGTSNPRRYEELGYSVLKMIMTRFMMEAITRPRKEFINGLPIYRVESNNLTRLRFQMLSDNALFCLARQRGLWTKGKQKPEVANQIKQLVGLVYYFLDGVRRFKDAFEITYQWFSQVFNLDRLWAEIGGTLECKYSRSYPIYYDLPEPVGINHSRLWLKPHHEAKSFISAPQMCSRALAANDFTYTADHQTASIKTNRANQITACAIAPSLNRANVLLDRMTRRG